jgi:hypothetical protein
VYAADVTAADAVVLAAPVGAEDAEPDALAAPLPPLTPNWVEYWKVPSASLMSWMP